MTQTKESELARIFREALAPAAKADPKPNSEDLRSQQAKQLELKNSAEALEQKLKEKIFTWVQWVVSIYLIFVAWIIAVSMIGMTVDKHLLSDKVLIALLTTTTVNVLGLPYLIIRALFKVRKKKSHKNKV